MARNQREAADYVAAVGAIYAMIEINIAGRMIADRGRCYSFHFEEIAELVSRLATLLSQHARLWCDLQRAIRAHRRSTHWAVLTEHVATVGQLHGKLMTLEAERARTSGLGRRRLTELINCIEGEIGFCRDLADRRGLASRINHAAGLPLVDGLTLHALTFVFGDDADAWTVFHQLVSSLEARQHGMINETNCR